MSAASSGAVGWIQSHAVRLRKRGQITIPQPVRDVLGVHEGDVLTLFQIGKVVMFTSRQPQVSRLVDKIAGLMEEEGVRMVDLLQGLAEERKAIWHEHADNA